MHAAAATQTPSSSSVRDGLKSKCTGPSYPPASRVSTTQNAPRALPAPNRKSWSKRGPCWPFRSMWNSLPCHSAWAMLCA